MSAPHDRRGSPAANDRSPRSQGWRQRAEAVRGPLAPDASWTLSASEIGAYTFCPQAWWLQRCRVPVTPEADARRQAGSRVHHDIGRQTDYVRAAGGVQTALLVAVVVVLLLLAVLVLRGLG